MLTPPKFAMEMTRPSRIWLADLNADRLRTGAGSPDQDKVAKRLAKTFGRAGSAGLDFDSMDQANACQLVQDLSEKHGHAPAQDQSIAAASTASLIRLCTMW